MWDDIDADGGLGLGDCIQCRADMAKIKPDGIPDYETGRMFDAMCVHGDAKPKWRPSIFMPRWACRITLEVTGVRVERVHEIAEDDAKAEGTPDTAIWCRPDANGEELSGAPWTGKFPDATYIAAYSHLWDRMNEKRGFGWAVNPWVWVVEFKRV